MTWAKVVKLHELDRGPVRLQLEPTPEERAAIAKQLGLQSLPALRADVTVKSWLDGVEISGRYRAIVEQICGVSLDAFEQPLEAEIELRAVPAGSPQAAAPDGGELELDPDAPDTPDVLDGDSLDVAAIVVEHLALDLDPFPRKPGATFEYEAPDVETSPFAALKKLTEPKA